MKYLFTLFLFCWTHIQAQSISSQSFHLDSLKPVLVQAFSQSTKWKEAGSAVAILNSADFSAFAPSSLVPAFNKLAGVRMEERSPGSYRLSIRGSLLRSAFGVRNTKIYINDFPLSDATGNTYFNLIDNNQIESAEVIKGPSSSIYGAGTGGVVLLNSLLSNTYSQNKSVEGEIEMGSYGLHKEQLSWKLNEKQFKTELKGSILSSDGFREQSAMSRLNLLYQAQLEFKKHQLGILSWYTDLYYQTPGGITQAQMIANPRLSRQPTASLPGAIQQNASIYNKTAFIGIKDSWKIARSADLLSFLTISNTNFENPFITNYEFRNETNATLGSKLIVHDSKSFKWITGLEWLYNHSVITDFGNKNGKIDTLQFNDQVFANQWSLYSQLEQIFFEKLHVSAGASLNQQTYQYQRVSNPLSSKQYKSTELVPAPRLSVLYDLQQNISAYGIVAYGFSPASLAELRPSDGNYYGNLEPERGWNFELGLKGFLMGQSIQYDLAYYHFQLKDAIVRRNNAAGAEYYINAGSTSQNGFEMSLKAILMKDHKGILNNLSLWTSHSFQPYRFINYQQGNIDYSGNKLTGVPRGIFVAGVDLRLLKRLQWHSSVNCVSKIPLTDANDAIADAYQLVQFKIDYLLNFKKWRATLFSGIDNVLNQNYSLGNDINAAGKRYYNPAAGRNYFLGFHFVLGN